MYLLGHWLNRPANVGYEGSVEYDPMKNAIAGGTAALLVLAATGSLPATYRTINQLDGL